MEEKPLIQSLVAGGLAGTCTDLFFFPIDTLKTRLQAKGGFFRNGGWRGVYSGVGSAIVASAPGASLFFICYDQGKQMLPEYINSPALVHMTSASIGEIAACSARVPSEVIKQRVQTGQYKSSFQALQSILVNPGPEGRFLGLYRGFWTTIMREIPFTAIQFPLYEAFKRKWAQYQGSDTISAPKGALCGSIAGGIAAALTTPLDVVKTRLMTETTRKSVTEIVGELSKDGPKAFFAGVVPRTMWISLGGAVFLGTYEVASSLLK